MKSAHIWSFSGPYFPAFGLNTESYEVSLCIQSECDKIRTRETLNKYTFHTVKIIVENATLQTRNTFFELYWEI